MHISGGCGLKYVRRAQRTRTGRQQDEVEVGSALSLYIGPLVQTTSDNASKAVPSSKSDWNFSRRRADNAKKVVLSQKLLNETLLAKSTSQNPRKTRCYCRKDTFSQNVAVEQITKIENNTQTHSTTLTAAPGRTPRKGLGPRLTAHAVVHPRKFN